MRKLPYKIRGMIEWHLQHYHEDKRQLEQAKKDLIPSYTAKYDADPVKSGVSDTTADTAIKLATSPYILSLERSIKAIDFVMTNCDETDLMLIDLVYWRRSHTVSGAADKCHLSKTAAYNRIEKIFVQIAKELGYLEWI